MAKVSPEHAHDPADLEHLEETMFMINKHVDQEIGKHFSGLSGQIAEDRKEANNKFMILAVVMGMQTVILLGMTYVVVALLFNL